MTEELLKAEIRKLEPTQRRNLVVDILDELDDELVDDDDDSDSELTPEFEAELDRRAKFCDEHPEQLITLEDADRIIRKKLGL